MELDTDVTCGPRCRATLPWARSYEDAVLRGRRKNSFSARATELMPGEMPATLNGGDALLEEADPAPLVNIFV